MVTPDRDVELTKLEVGDTYTEVKVADDKRLPRGVREDDTYLPRHSDKGDLSRDEWMKLIRAQEKKMEARELKRAEKADPKGKAAAAPRGGRADADLSGPAEDQVDDAKVWLVIYRSGSGDLGVECDPPQDTGEMIVNGKSFKLFSRGGEELLVRGVELAQVEEMKKIFSYKQAVPEEQVKDVLILPVFFDAAEERYRTLQEAVPEYEEIDFDDYPLQGPRTMFRDLKQLRRTGQDFMMHHEAWVKKSGVRPADRSVYEHSSLCRALQLMMSYDQLNLPALASAEALNRRRALIEHAHSGRPDTPSYEGAEEFMGIKDTADGSLVDPALLQHTAKRQAAKAEIMKQSRLAAEERKAASKKGEGKGQKDKGAKDAPNNP